ncbi:cytochrome c oxidase subunit 3 [Novosphingobium profundi]|uniref:cytochrome c oxidase subunit 3 n=1 Tax=Novosphingobium profundi TaxID=1774954 RepID=UPI001BD9B0B7|nr:cytochrome c oxidase subunit 3 [Novosphingobium profundi]MBT0667617.1 cytochrome c oxidase subunit 3 [Novosphingobium profundi]
MAEDLVLHEPFEEAARQRIAVPFGVWSFLATECLFFGGILLFYAYARWHGGEAFTQGAKEAAVWYGTINTAVLMTSSLTMAIAERATKGGFRVVARWMLGGTLMLGLSFLVIKGFEYRKDVHEHLIPGPGFKFGQGPAAQFWAFYWTATVTHAIHVTIGLGIIARLLWIERRGDLLLHATSAQGGALYWHLVDIVWVVLYPLLYLVGRP